MYFDFDIYISIFLQSYAILGNQNMLYNNTPVVRKLWTPKVTAIHGKQNAKTMQRKKTNHGILT